MSKSQNDKVVANPTRVASSRANTSTTAGWRAAASGEQVVRLLFDEPRPMTLVELRFDEPAAQRTQEFVLRWSSDGGRSYRDIVRQQYTFSPPGTTSEAERITVNLSGVTALEDGGDACSVDPGIEQ